MKKISTRSSLLVLGASLCAPLLAFAQAGAVNQQWAQYYRDTIVWGVNFVLVPVLMAIAFIVFLWGVYKYFILGADSDTERATGRQFVLWGVLGFVIITSVWGLVNIVGQTLIPTTAGSTHPNYPTL